MSLRNPFIAGAGRLGALLAFALLLASGPLAYAANSCGYVLVPPSGGCSANVGSAVNCQFIVEAGGPGTPSYNNAQCASLSATPYVNSGSSQMTLQSIQYIISGNNPPAFYNVRFSPTSGGAQTATLVIPTSFDGTYNFTLNATGVATVGTLSLSSSTLTCPSVAIGEGAVCGSITVTANGAPITLSSPLYTLSNPSTFSAATGTCTPGAQLPGGASCTLGPIKLTAASAGNYSTTISVNTSDAGSKTVTASGTAYPSTCVPNPSQGKYCLVTPLR